MINNLNKTDCSHITGLTKCSNSGQGCVACTTNNDCNLATFSQCNSNSS